ncbi:MAG: IS4 family transposase [bacterium]
MAYHTTILGQMLQLVSRLEFQSLVIRHNGDYRARKLRCWDQFVYLLLGQFGSRDSLRETISASDSLQSKLYHLGACRLCRSTLSDANNKRPSEIYRDLFFRTLEKVQMVAPKYKLKLPRKLFIMDSTTIDLCLKLFPWARFRKTKAAVKIHTVLQVDGLLPTFLHISDGKTHDAKAARKLDLPQGSFVVFDRGYNDFCLFKSFTDSNIRFVTRKKSNAKFHIIKSQTVEPGTGVLSDEMIEFTGHYSKQKYPNQLRLIRYHDKENNKKLTFLTNDLKLDAKTIADIYKARWEIELFFKTVKQNLKIKRFMGTSRNAVMIQIWIAMIAYMLTSYYKFLHQTKASIQTILRLIQINLFERKPLKELIELKVLKPPRNSGERQYSFLTGH